MVRCSAAIGSMMMAATVFGQVGPLSNSGFEEVQGSMPAGWKVFVAPQPGATGELDAEHAFEGQNSIRLHIPTPYSVEPANNWSQPLPIEKTGVRVHIRAEIKTHDATEAAIWLQCFKRDPWMVLKQVSSSTDAPVYGTVDWTPVAFDALIPHGTDYAMIRCVLKGHGTAWFDNVTVTVTDDPTAGTAKPVQADVRETPIEATPPEPESISPVEPIPVPAQPPVATTGLPTQSANHDLHESNEALANQLQQLQEEIAELRSVLAQPTPKSEIERKPPPPLVPHGYQWKENQE